MNSRHKEYKEIFGQDTNFKIILQLEEKDLVPFENQLIRVFEPYCLRSPNNNVQMEWMEKISFENAEKIIVKEFKKFNLNKSQADNFLK